MEIQEKLMKFIFHAIFGVIISISIYIIARMSPRFIDLIGFFWPLLASTALFLGVVVVFSRVTPQATDGLGEKAGEGLLDYVAGPPEDFGETYKNQ
ncbi:hypothetical protein RND81_09G062600 [Saponaria officinalis]|uniref:Uncharacterized protein n=1 Tax=Saponaria officinalis TaxID=3572 RepID=A0AAW1IJD6_SAPOF